MVGYVVQRGNAPNSRAARAEFALPVAKILARAFNQRYNFAPAGYTDSVCHTSRGLTTVARVVTLVDSLCSQVRLY